MSRPSMRWRVTAWTCVVALLIQLMLGTLVFFYQRYTFDQLFSSRLVNRSEMILTSLERAPEGLSDAVLQRAAEGPMFFAPTEHYEVVLFRADGTPLAATPSPATELASYGNVPRSQTNPITVSRRQLPMIDTGDGGDAVWRVLLRRATSPTHGELVLVVATTDAYFEQMIQVLSRVLLLALAVGIASTSVATWLITGLALSPLKQLSELASAFVPSMIRQETRIQPVPRELAEFQEQLATARESLRTTLKAQDRLISNVSHEVKTPIAVLLAEAETVNVAALNEEGQQFVASVRAEMLKLGETIEAFMLLSRLRSGQTLGNGNVCSLMDVVLEALEASESSLLRRGVSVNVEADDNDDTLTIMGNKDLLKSMIVHMIGNSARAAKPGTSVHISVTRDGAVGTVAIRDQGDPVLPANAGTLFDRFIERGGTGDVRRDLGLSIAQGIAEIHGGLISVAASAGGGCEFLIRLPLASDHKAESENSRTAVSF